MELLSEKTYSMEDLTIWRYFIPEVKIAKAPALTSRTNPVVFEGLVVVSVLSPGSVLAFDRLSGAKCWQFELGYFGHSHVYATAGYLYAWTPKRLVCLDPSSGQLIWQFSPHGRRSEYFYAAPTCANNNLFIGDHRGWFYCLEATTGNIRWSTMVSSNALRGVNATALVRNGIVVTVNLEGFIIAFVAETGDEIWRTEIEDTCLNEILSWGEFALVPTTNTLYVVSLIDGVIVHRKRWEEHRIDSYATTPTGVCVVVTASPELVDARMSNKNAAIAKGSSILLSLQGNDLDTVAWKLDYPPFPASRVGWNQSTGFVYEATNYGLGIVDPETGVRQVCIYEPKQHPNDRANSFALPEVSSTALYALSSSGHVFALRHP